MNSRWLLGWLRFFGRCLKSIKAPVVKKPDWIQTWPGKGWNVILRIYGPMQPWFDKTRQPGEIEELP